MQRTINFYPVGIAFLLSAVVILCLRLWFDEKKIIKDVTISAHNLIPREITGHPLASGDSDNGPKYASPKLKGMVYTSDTRIDRWMKDSEKNRTSKQ